MKNILSIIVGVSLVISLTGCRNNSASGKLTEEDIIKDLNEVVTNYKNQNKDDEYFVVGVDDMQQQLQTYKSNYKLLGSSENEYTTKPSTPNQLFRAVDMNYPLCTLSLML